MKKIVVIEEANVLAPGNFDRSIVGDADAATRRKLYSHARAYPTEQLQQLPRLTIVRTVIDETPFPISARLIEKAQGGFGEPLRLGVVGGGYDAELRIDGGDPPAMLLKAWLKQLNL
jgi:hypothetical protein